MWEFGWWAHSLETLTNPFVTDVIYSPVGADIWTATAPGLALVFAPLTMLVGPVAAFNVAILLEPAFAAWTASPLPVPDEVDLGLGGCRLPVRVLEFRDLAPVRR